MYKGIMTEREAMQLLRTNILFNPYTIWKFNVLQLLCKCVRENIIPDHVTKTMHILCEENLFQFHLNFWIAWNVLPQIVWMVVCLNIYEYIVPKT